MTNLTNSISLRRITKDKIATRMRAKSSIKMRMPTA